MTDSRPPAPEGLIAELSTDPIAMLPVRIETRFFTADGGTSDDGPVSELRVRIYPDALHAHAHVDAISPEEHRAGIQYWEQRVDGEPSIAWRTLRQRIPAPRAAWVARSLTPTNLDQQPKGIELIFPSPPIHEAPWTEPPRAVALPSRWIVVGIRDGDRIYQGLGSVIPGDLPLGPTPDPSTDDEPQTQDRPPDDQDELAIDDGMRWLTDYDAAVTVGMALTIADDEVAGGLADGFDRLLAIGVPAGNAQTLEQLLEAHRHTDGLAFVRQGTATNNTADVPSGVESSDDELAQSLDPANPEATPISPANSNGGRLASALGLGEGPMVSLLGGDGREYDDGGLMNELLWETTWGYFLDQYLSPRIADDAAADMRAHFVDHVRGRGPLSAIRVGDQPYGIIPAVSGQHFVPDDPVEARLHQLLGSMTGLWGHASGRSPQLAKLLAPEADLVDILEGTPNSTTVRARAVLGPVVAANTDGLSRFAAAGEATDNWLAEMIFQGQRVSGADYLARPDARLLQMPYVTADELSESDPLSPNYLTRLLVMMRRGGAFSAIQSYVEPAVLAILVRQAGQLEFAKAAARLVIEHRSQVTGIPRPPRVAPMEPELIDFGYPTENLAGFATAPYGPISGTQSMADYLAAKSIGELRSDPDTAALADFIENLQAVADLPTAELTRLLAETLDLCSHRIDAWHTSLAGKRLAAMRAGPPPNDDYEDGPAYSDGVHVGAFGWLHDVRPEPAPDSLGYVHAPSLGQATTAAVLRSAHLAARADGAGSDDPYAIDLSAERVRHGLEIMNGVRSGLSLGAMLGYRFERGLREFDLELAQYILDFRRFAPLRSSTSPNDPGPLEALAARDVVDGRKLVERWEQGRESFFDGLDFTVPNPHQDGISVVLHRLADDVDAVSDLLVAESVHQTIHGNRERAAAALDALDRQGPPPDPEVIRTPRSGFGVEHRLLVSLTATDVGPGWPSAADARALAEPRLNSWVGRLLGDPRRIRFAAEVVDPSIEDPVFQVVQVVEAALDDLGISPLSVVWAEAEGGTSGITELDERVARALAPLVTPVEGTELELRLLEGDRAVENWPADTVGLANLHTMAEAIREVISGSAMAEPDDFVDPNDEDSATLDVAEHQSRADAALAGLAAVSATIAQLLADGVSEQPAVDALTAAAGFGIGGALPDDPDRLTDQLAEVGRVVARRKAEAEEADLPADRIKAIFANGFVSLTMFAPPGAADLDASLADRAALTGGDPLAATTWLQQSGLVRPATAAFHRLLSNAEMIGSQAGPVDLDVVQAPHTPGDRWVALPLVKGGLPEANVGLVIHRPDGFAGAPSQAGLVIDRWNESIPDPVETTGVSFHYDAPGTRAPQTILLAVPGDRSAERWSLAELIGVIDSTFTMAQVRSVDPQRLWMLNTALPAIYLSANSRGAGISTNLYQAESLHRAQVDAP